jgi:endonuclease YncB( thermonuclease family)
MLLLTAACAPRPSTAVEPDVGPAVALDGATLSVDGETLRLAGIDVPRLPPRARCWAEALLAREARQVLEAELDLATGLEIVSVDGGRSEAVEAFARGKRLSQLMLERGLAVESETRWDWCGPVDMSAAGGPRLNQPVEAAPSPPR